MSDSRACRTEAGLPVLCGTAPSRPGAIRLPSGSSSPAAAKVVATSRRSAATVSGSPRQRSSVRVGPRPSSRRRRRAAHAAARGHRLGEHARHATHRGRRARRHRAHLDQPGRILRSAQPKQRVVARHERESLPPQARQGERQLAVGIAAAQRDAAALDLGRAQRDGDAARQAGAGPIAPGQRLGRAQRRRVEQRQAGRWPPLRARSASGSRASARRRGAPPRSSDRAGRRR